MSRTTVAAKPGPDEIIQHAPLLERTLHHLRYTQAKHWEGATDYDKYASLAMAAREDAVDKMIDTQSVYADRHAKRVYYLSLEYLMGRQLRNHLINLGSYDQCCDGFKKLGADLERVLKVETDPGLGNGGLGRLAACYLDSAATLELPVYGYGIRYEYGIFEQRIENGWQVEKPEYWLQYGTPWELVRPEYATEVRLYGRVEQQSTSDGRHRAIWKDCRTVIGVPYDMVVPGYRNNTVNILRLWSSRASMALDMEKFNRGGFIEAVEDKVLSETVSKVLYPADETEHGKDLRLIQQYFFVACTITDVIRRYERENKSLDSLPDKVAIQLNDTHPSLAVAELMRVLVDERGLGWDQAWEMATAIFAYTNHTLLPEALEVWPVSMFERILPRHLQIIYEINHRFLKLVERRWPGDEQRHRRLSLIQEESPRSVRMAHLAIVGSHTVNGVADLHSRLIRSRLVPDFAELWPEKFTNVTNGVTPRRFLRACNPGLSELITARIGEGWVRDLDQLHKLVDYADDPEFQTIFMQVKLDNKRALADWTLKTKGMRLRTDAMYDVQIKRLHEYKRQLLNLLHLVMMYHELLEDPKSHAPRVVLFSAKAAPSYHRAKLIIKLIHDVAHTINHDQRIGDRLKVVFLPNYRVSLAELIIPATDLSEQISTAGFEASGTGNMKFALNGALTIGTLDGANIEIRDAVGEDNFFLFGLSAEQVTEQQPHHDPWQVYNSNDAVRAALDAIAAGTFNPSEPHLHREVHDWLTGEGDYYMLMADIESYVDAQGRAEALWKDQTAWARAAILNVANVGRFSSDRAVREYAERIWRVQPVPVKRSKKAGADAGRKTRRATGSASRSTTRSTTRGSTTKASTRSNGKPRKKTTKKKTKTK